MAGPERVARHDDHPYRRVEVADARQDFESTEPRHRQVQKDHTGALVGDGPERFQAVRRLQHLVPLFGEVFLK